MIDHGIKGIYVSIAAFILLISPQLVFAQDRFDAGINGGFGISSITESDQLPVSNKPAFCIGMQFSFRLSDRLSLVLNPSFENAGFGVLLSAQDENGALLTGISAHQNLNYIKVPIFMRSDLGQKRKMFIQFGPYAAYLLSSNLELTDFDDEIKDQPLYNVPDIGLAFGLGRKFYVNAKTYLQLAARATRGLGNIRASNSADEYEPSNWSLLFVAGFHYSL